MLKGAASKLPFRGFVGRFLVYGPSVATISPKIEVPFRSRLTKTNIFSNTYALANPHSSLGGEQTLLWQPFLLPGVESSASAKEMPPQVASVVVEAPADRIVEQLDPLPNLIPIADPPAADRWESPPMYAGVRMLMIRRKKMRKFKRKKHQKRDAFLLEKLRLQKQMKAEAFFRARMNELRNDMENFDPLQYAKSVIKSAERQWESRLAPSGKKRYGHWSEVISLDELYGIQPSTYIDKRAGLFTAPEDCAKFEQQRADYLAKYTRRAAAPPKAADDEQN